MSPQTKSAKDEAALARLVRKKGAAAVHEEVDWTPERRANPDDMFFAIWIDELTDEHGSQKVALNAACEIAFSKPLKNIASDVVRRYLWNAKKKYQRGRQMNLGMAEHGGILKFRTGE